MTLRLLSQSAAPGLCVDEYRAQGPHRIAPHLHEQMQVGFLMGGGYAGDGDVELDMSGPAVVLYPTYTKTGAAFGDCAHHFLWISIEDAWLEEMGLAQALPAKPAISTHAPLLRAAATLRAAARPGRNAAPIEIEAALFELLRRALGEAPGATGPPPRWWRDALDLLYSDEQTWSLGAMARRLDLHPAHLARAFKAHAGCSIGEHHRRIRLTAAARDLRRSDARVAEIAARRGFFDQSHFNRHFRRAFGRSPSQFRASLSLK